MTADEASRLLERFLRSLPEVPSLEVYEAFLTLRKEAGLPGGLARRYL